MMPITHNSECEYHETSLPEWVIQAYNDDITYARFGIKEFSFTGESLKLFVRQTTERTAMARKHTGEWEELKMSGGSS